MRRGLQEPQGLSIWGKGHLISLRFFFFFFFWLSSPPSLVRETENVLAPNSGRKKELWRSWWQQQQQLQSLSILYASTFNVFTKSWRADPPQPLSFRLQYILHSDIRLKRPHSAFFFFFCGHSRYISNQFKCITEKLEKQESIEKWQPTQNV